MGQNVLSPDLVVEHVEVFGVKTFGASTTVIFPYGPSLRGFLNSFLPNDTYPHTITTTVIESPVTP
jgi:hypothetical protein